VGRVGKSTCEHSLSNKRSPHLTYLTYLTHLTHLTYLTHLTQKLRLTLKSTLRVPSTEVGWPKNGDVRTPL